MTLASTGTGRAVTGSVPVGIALVVLEDGAAFGAVVVAGVFVVGAAVEIVSGADDPVCAGASLTGGGV